MCLFIGPLDDSSLLFTLLGFLGLDGGVKVGGRLSIIEISVNAYQIDR